MTMKHKSKLLINFIFLLAILLFGACTVRNNSLIDARQKRTKELKTISTSDSLSTELYLLRMLDKKDFLTENLYSLQIMMVIWGRMY